MARPENVADALTIASDNSTVGNYQDVTLRSAYQPVYSPGKFGECDLVGFEGLVRAFRDDTPVSPAEFFPTIGKQDRLFIECMCMAMHIRNYKHLPVDNKKLFLNVDVSVYDSMAALEREIFYTFSQLSKNGLRRENLIFEILETEVLEIDILKLICDMFRSNGFRFALDDFGTKHSNIERFLQTRSDIVKLDRAIFSGFNRHRETGKLLRSLINAFRENDATVLLEGIESEEEIQCACELNIDLLQGFALGKPQLIHSKFEATRSIGVRPANPSLALINP